MVVYNEDLSKVLQDIAMDPDQRKFYNCVRRECLENDFFVYMKKDRDFGNLYRKVHYTGSHFDRLKVGNRLEYDLNIIFRTPGRISIRNGSEKQPHFMDFKAYDDDKDFDCIINNDYTIDPLRAFKVLHRAADRALTWMRHISWVGDIPVRITRSVRNPYTLLLKPTRGRYTDVMEIDMCPAFEIPVNLLPRDTVRRVEEVEDRVGVWERNCLAIALPIVNAKQFQIDFPMHARKIMANKPSFKAAVRLLKCERDEMGGQFIKIWSYAMKNCGLWEAYKLPGHSWWTPDQLGNRFYWIRHSLANCLLNNELKDLFFPSLNMMKRIKSEQVKEATGKYLQRTNQLFLQSP